VLRQPRVEGGVPELDESFETIFSDEAETGNDLLRISRQLRGIPIGIGRTRWCLKSSCLRSCADGENRRPDFERVSLWCRSVGSTHEHHVACGACTCSTQYL